MYEKSAVLKETIPKKQSRLMSEMYRHRYFYLMLIPGALFYIIFCYAPIYGITLAFKDFQYAKGIMGSPWVGLRNFRDIFVLQDFWTAFSNTLIISIQRLIFEFPVPVILALMLNEVRNRRLKGFLQTVYTFPNFLSWIVVSGIVVTILGSDGTLNQIIRLLGGAGDLSLLTSQDAFRPILYITSIWKSAGYSSIIYLAAIASINPELYEAAMADGANRLWQLRAITWPGIQSTVAIMLILAVGNMMNAGFDQIFNMYNPAVYDKVDILDTFIFRRTFVLGADFASSTVVGSLKSVINVTLVMTANFIITRLGEEGIV